MALSNVLGQNGMTAESIDTIATVTFDKVGAGFEITDIHLDLTARIPGADPAKFQESANTAKINCPVSKVLKANITLDAKLA